MNILYVILLAVLAGVLYRLGGIGKPWNSKVRDLGCPAVMIATMAILGHWHWSLIMCAGLLFASLTTYNKWAGYFFNRPDKHTVYLESWIITGLFYGLSIIPYVFFVSHDYVMFGVRCVLLAVLTGLFSHVIGKVFWEEFSRGFLIISTLLILN